MVGAAAQRLGLGRRGIVAAGGKHDDLLDQAGAGTAGGRGLGVLAHVFQREQPLFLDRLDDGALADAVAAADLGRIRHRRGHGEAFMPGVAGAAGVGFAEHQRVADLGNVATLAQQLEVPAAVDRVAVQAGADQLVVLQHQLLVDAAYRVGQHDFLGAFAAHEFTGREQVDAGDLQLGRRDRSLVAADAEAREMIGRHLGHLEQRRDQAVGGAAVVHAFADRVDARVVGLHRVVDHDAAVAVDAAGFGQRGVGPDADRHHHQLRGHFEAVVETDRLHMAVPVADQLLRVLRQQELEAAVFQRFLQHLAGDRVELALHQPAGQVHDGDVHAAQLQAVGRFESQQAAADHHRMRVRFGRGDHRIGVMDVAVGNDAREVLARHRQHERRRAGRQQQPVVLGLGAVLRHHDAARAVDPVDGLPEMQRDAVFGVPVDIVEHDVLDGLLAGQHRRQQDAVVVCVRLGPEHRDVVYVGSDLDQFFQRTHACHAVADHDQFQLLH